MPDGLNYIWYLQRPASFVIWLWMSLSHKVFAFPSDYSCEGGSVHIPSIYLYPSQTKIDTRRICPSIKSFCLSAQTSPYVCGVRERVASPLW